VGRLLSRGDQRTLKSAAGSSFEGTDYVTKYRWNGSSFEGTERTQTRGRRLTS
jgi:hypothetical protein